MEKKTQRDQAYKFPLYYDGMNYIWGKDNGMVLMFDIDDNSSNKVRYDIVKALNGDDDNIVVPIEGLRYEGGDYYVGDRLFMVQRGWGHLTGANGLNLDEDEAIRVQDEFAEYVVSVLTCIT